MIILVMSIVSIIIILLLLLQGYGIQVAKNLDPFIKNETSKTDLEQDYTTVEYISSSLGQPCDLNFTGTNSSYINLPYNYSIQGCSEGLKCEEGFYENSGACKAMEGSRCNSLIDCSDNNSCIRGVCRRFDGFLNSECVPSISSCPEGYSCDTSLKLCKINSDENIECKNNNECYNSSNLYLNVCIKNKCYQEVPYGTSETEAEGRACQNGGRFINGFCQNSNPLTLDSVGKVNAGYECRYDGSLQCSTGLKCLFWRDTYEDIETHSVEKIRDLKTEIGVCGVDSIDNIKSPCSKTTNCIQSMECGIWYTNSNIKTCKDIINKNICHNGFCPESYLCENNFCKTTDYCRNDSDCAEGYTCDKTHTNLHTLEDNASIWKNDYSYSSPLVKINPSLNNPKFSSSKENVRINVDNNYEEFTYVLYHQLRGNNNPSYDENCYFTVIFTPVLGDKFLIRKTVNVFLKTRGISFQEIRILDVKVDIDGVIQVFYMFRLDSYLDPVKSKYPKTVLFTPLTRNYTGGNKNTILKITDLYNLNINEAITLNTLSFGDNNLSYLENTKPFYTYDYILDDGVNEYPDNGKRIYDYYFEFCSSTYPTPKLNTSNDAIPKYVENETQNPWNVLITTCVKNKFNYLGVSEVEKFTVSYTFYRNFNSNIINAHPENYTKIYSNQNFNVEFYVFNRKLFTCLEGHPSSPCTEAFNITSDKSYTYNFNCFNNDGGITEYNMHIIEYDNTEVNNIKWSNSKSAIDFDLKLKNAYLNDKWDYVNKYNIYGNYDNLSSSDENYLSGNLASYTPPKVYNLKEDGILQNIKAFIPGDVSRDSKYILLGEFNGNKAAIQGSKTYLYNGSIWFNYTDEEFDNKNTSETIPWRNLTYGNISFYKSEINIASDDVLLTNFGYCIK